VVAVLIQSQKLQVMENTRRNFLKKVGAVGATAAIIGPLAACSNTDSNTEASQAIPEEKQALPADVKKRTGPFGEGLPITMAGYEYTKVKGIIDGSVQVAGCQTTFEVSGIGQMNNHAFFGEQTRDITEIGLIPYILAYANDEFRDYELLPIPVLRLFRHKSIFIRTDRGIKKPADLRGKKVATVGYSSSGLTHVRGILQEQYGVKPDEIEWIAVQKDSASNLTGGVSAWEKVRPEGISITDAPDGEDESTLLISGKVDAILHPADPKVYQDRNPIVERLFKDHRTVERKFFKETGMFPIMHTVAIRKKTAKENPWLAKAVFEAYSQAKFNNYHYIRKMGWAMDSLPWYGQEFNETRELMGDNFYPYGLKASKASYEAAFRYTYEQGLSKRLVTPEEMFEQSTLDLEENFII
jgi:4,5-dihydroxyphthalate decarboxylase